MSKKSASNKELDDIMSSFLDSPAHEAEDAAETEPEPSGPSVPQAILKGNELSWERPESLETHPRFKSLWTMKADDREHIAQSMREQGYDREHPVIMGRWPGLHMDIPVIVDGHTRRQAAIDAEIDEIPCRLRDFVSEDAAFAYALSLQFDRRNLTDADRLIFLRNWMTSVDLVMTRQEGKMGRPQKVYNRDTIATLLRVSTGTASKYLQVVGNEALFVKVVEGSMSINQAALSMQDESPAKKKESGQTADVAPAREVERSSRAGVGSQYRYAPLQEKARTLGFHGDERTRAAVISVLTLLCDEGVLNREVHEALINL